MSKVSFEHSGNAALAERAPGSSNSLWEFMQQNDPFLIENSVQASIQQEVIAVSPTTLISEAIDTKSEKHSTPTEANSLWDFMQQNDPYFNKGSRKDNLAAKTNTPIPSAKSVTTSRTQDISQPIKAEYTTHNWVNRHPKLAKTAAAAVGFLAMGSLINIVQSNEVSGSNYEKSEITATPQTTATSETQTTATPVEITTTTAEKKPFSVQPGEVMAYINLPTIAEDITVFELSHEQAQAAAIDNRGSEQLSPIDQLIPDETPNQDNAQVEEWAERSGAISREHRERNSAKGRVNQWKSVAGHTQVDTIYPDARHAGNSVIFGHGSTFNAAFANLGALHDGDPLVMLRADGEVLNYSFIEKEIVKAPNLNDQADVIRSLKLLNGYRDGDGESYVTLYHCSDQAGLPGDDSHRAVYRFKLNK